MVQVDAALAVQPVKALHHIIRLAGPDDETGPGDDARAITPGGECGHGPEPGFLNAMERLFAGVGDARRNTIRMVNGCH
jgi:hypothetical protein